jgi:trypsin-like peptidase
VKGLLSVALLAVATAAPAAATAPANATPSAAAATAPVGPPPAGPAQDGRTIQRGVLRPGIGADDPRRPVDVRAEPWRALGRVQLDVGGRCTGVLVGPRTVLTAAHCLFGPRSRQVVRPGTVHFLLGYHMGEWAARARVASFTMGDGFALDRASPHGGPLGADWALLTLDAPLGEGRALRLRRDLPPSGTELMLAGYQQDRPEALLADTGCRAIGLRRGAGNLPLLAHGCAGTRGASGAPLLARGRDGKWEVVAVASAMAADAAQGVAVPAGTLPAAAATPSP